MAEEFPVEQPEDVPVALGGDAQMSVREAGRLLASFRHSKPAEPPPPSPLAAEVAAAESGEQPVEAAPETDPGEIIETPTEEPAEELPPIDPPRSWSREWKEEFQNYPRELQEKVAAREQERETALRRGQNEAAEQRKAIEAQRAQVEQSRKHYEEALPQLMAMLQQQQMGEFSDIKTMADVDKMAREDWPRFSAYQAHQMKVQAVQQQMRDAQQRQQNEYQQQWSKFSADEDAKYLELHPEMADPAKAATMTQFAQSALTSDYGFSDDDLGKLWGGQASISLRDHRMQSLIYDAMRFRQAKAAVPKAAAKVVPKVQRPGSPAQRVPDSDARQRALINNLEGMTGLRAARMGAELIAERRGRR